jgi:hypothetical protein
MDMDAMSRFAPNMTASLEAAQLAMDMGNLSMYQYQYQLQCASSSPLLDPLAQSRSQRSGGYLQPLLPGLYNLVPKHWLKAWRQFVRDPAPGSKPPPMDCTSMLCHSHGLLVVPPHLEEYLLGVRKSLLSGLSEYPGEVVEVLSAEEWDALQLSLRSLSDFSVRFCLDGENVSWNIGVCSACSSFNYGPCGRGSGSGMGRGCHSGLFN